MLTHGDVKNLIEGAGSFSQADAIISGTYCKTDADKIQYLKDLFDLDIKSGDKDRDTYVMLVGALINRNGLNMVESMIDLERNDYTEGYRAGYYMGLKDGAESGGKAVSGKDNSKPSGGRKP